MKTNKNKFFILSAIIALFTFTACNKNDIQEYDVNYTVQTEGQVTGSIEYKDKNGSLQTLSIPSNNEEWKLNLKIPSGGQLYLKASGTISSKGHVFTYTTAKTTGDITANISLYEGDHINTNTEKSFTYVSNRILP